MELYRLFSKEKCYYDSGREEGVSRRFGDRRKISDFLKYIMLSETIEIAHSAKKLIRTRSGNYEKTSRRKSALYTSQNAL